MDKPLDDETSTFLKKLAATRRLARKVDPKYGIEGEYYVEDDESVGVVDINTPPSTQPGLWCQWVPTEDNNGIVWDGNEKFYEADKWMAYIISILANKGYIANGIIEAQGEDTNDHWYLSVSNNKVSVLSSKDLLDKALAYDLLLTPFDDLPLHVGQDLPTIAKDTLNKLLNGKIKVTITE